MKISSAQPVSAAGLHSVTQYLVAFWAQILHQVAVVVVVPERRQHDSPVRLENDPLRRAGLYNLCSTRGHCIRLQSMVALYGCMQVACIGGFPGDSPLDLLHQ